jgi:hypothetical protein
MGEYSINDIRLFHRRTVIQAAFRLRVYFEKSRTIAESESAAKFLWAERPIGVARIAHFPNKNSKRWK